MLGWLHTAWSLRYYLTKLGAYVISFKAYREVWLTFIFRPETSSVKSKLATNIQELQISISLYCYMKMKTRIRYFRSRSRSRHQYAFSQTRSLLWWTVSYYVRAGSNVLNLLAWSARYVTRIRAYVSDRQQYFHRCKPLDRIPEPHNFVGQIVRWQANQTITL